MKTLQTVFVIDLIVDISVALVATTSLGAEKVRWKMQSTFGSKLSIIGESGKHFEKLVTDLSGGSLNIKSMSASSESWPRLSRCGFALGLPQANISSTDAIDAIRRISSADSRSLKKSRSSDCSPACERASLALRHVLHLVQ